MPAFTRRTTPNPPQAATYIEPLNWGYTTFDNFAVAFLSVFQCITMEGWTEIMYQLMDGMGAVAAAVYFSVLILFGSLFVLNLLLAVMEGNFRRSRPDEAEGESWRQGECVNVRLRSGAWA